MLLLGPSGSPVSLTHGFDQFPPRFHAQSPPHCSRPIPLKRVTFSAEATRTEKILDSDQTRCGCGQTLLPQGDGESLRTTRHYARCLRRFASSDQGIEISGKHSPSRSDTLQSNLNNVVKQDHRRSNSEYGRCSDSNEFDYVAVTVSGIEFVEKNKKHQFMTGKSGGRSATVPELWNAVLVDPGISDFRKATARLTSFAPEPYSEDTLPAARRPPAM